MRNFFFIFIWFLSLILFGLYIHERPEIVQNIKYYLVHGKPEIKIEKSNVQKILANSFVVEFSKEISLSAKTAFIYYDENIKDFNEKFLKIYSQNGYLTENLQTKKLNLPKNFTEKYNGGIKTVFIHKGSEFALISSHMTDCYYASIVLLSNGNELYKTQCLPKEDVDYNGLGSSNLHYKNQILLSIGAPEQKSSKIRALAQDPNSAFGKILEINKTDLEEIIVKQKGTLNLKLFSLGHRNPQGLTRIGDLFFSVEHGPRGGDELNKIIKDKNYGWPVVSYGTQYFYDQAGKSYEISHENNKFEEPLFALVPSVGISSLNNCPIKLKEYYKKPCLLALSLYGNNLRPGRSLIIYLLSSKMDKVHSVEQIYLKDDLLLRHFVTNSKNEIYEDKNGSIYVSADKNGIYKINFIDFRN